MIAALDPATTLLVALLVASALLLFTAWRSAARLRKDLRLEFREQREELTRSSFAVADSLMKRVTESASVQQLELDSVRDAVTRQLAHVQRGLGEVQTLSSSLGDIRQLFSNVKTRGTWGEVQLEQLLEEFLAPHQYERQTAAHPKSDARVDFALRIEMSDGTIVRLPIDAKFPQEDYLRLEAARQRGDRTEETRATRALERRIRHEARQIGAKYVAPPYTTDFAVLYLPTESLYAEVMRQPHLIEELQREARIILASPTTLSALLNTFQMSLRALSVRRHTGEAWQALASTRAEVERFAERLDQASRKLGEAVRTLDSVQNQTVKLRRHLRNLEQPAPAPPPAPATGSHAE